MRVTYLGVSNSPSFISKNSVQIPLYTESTILPSDERVEEKRVDLNKLVIPRPMSTFFVRAQGESMISSGINSGDVLVVDRSLTAKHSDVIITRVRGEMTVRTLELNPEVLLRPKNTAYSASTPNGKSEFEVFGVVTSVVRQLTRSES